jgi:hypothetical protein
MQARYQRRGPRCWDNSGYSYSSVRIPRSVISCPAHPFTVSFRAGVITKKSRRDRQCPIGYSSPAVLIYTGPCKPVLTARTSFGTSCHRVVNGDSGRKNGCLCSNLPKLLSDPFGNAFHRQQHIGLLSTPTQSKQSPCAEVSLVVEPHTSTTLRQF